MYENKKQTRNVFYKTYERKKQKTRNGFCKTRETKKDSFCKTLFVKVWKVFVKRVKKKQTQDTFYKTHETKNQKTQNGFCKTYETKNRKQNGFF